MQKGYEQSNKAACVLNTRYRAVTGQKQKVSYVVDGETVSEDEVDASLNEALLEEVTTIVVIQ